MHTSAAQMPDRKVLINGQEFLFFSGTAYLCMNNNAAFNTLIQEGMHLFGSNYGSSRSGNFKLPVFDIAEQAIAAYAGAETAITVSSGFMAAQLVVRHFEQHALFCYAPDCHPALFRTPNDFYSGSFEGWPTTVKELVQNKRNAHLVLLCNSLDPLTLETYDFSWLEDLEPMQKITLVVDDSHGIGITGNNGAGIYQEISNHENIDVVVVCSLNKALGVPGGVILGKAATLNNLRSSSYYTSASPIPPAYLHAFLHAAPIYAAERAALQSNLNLLEQLLHHRKDIRLKNNYPVVYCKDNDLAEKLYQENVLISSFRYPLPTSDLITRIIVNSHHTPEDLRHLAQLMELLQK